MRLEGQERKVKIRRDWHVGGKLKGWTMSNGQNYLSTYFFYFKLYNI